MISPEDFFMVEAVYAAGPIDAVTTGESRDWQDSLAEALPDILIFSPAHPYFNASFKRARHIDRINRWAIDVCQCVVAYLPPGRQAFGTIREIEYSVQAGYPTIVVGPEVRSFLTYDLVRVNTIQEVSRHLVSSG